MAADREHLILKSLEGIISDEEQRELNAWLAISAENKKLADDMQRIWQIRKKDVSIRDFDSEGELIRLMTSIHAEKASTKVIGMSRAVWLKAAAAFALLVISSFIIYLRFYPQRIVHIASENAVHVLLPDNSSVWLNANSTLAYEKDFNVSHRSIELKGQAFFDVVKNPDKPFIIDAEQARIQVVGTSFDVRAYNTDSHTEVFVMTGLVKFSGLSVESEPITLKAGETGVLRKMDDLISKKAEDDPNILAWKEKRLSFRKTSLRDVVRTLQRYFRVDISVANEKLLDCRFTSAFNDPTLTEVIDALTISLDLKVIRQNNGYILNGDGC
jgi:ferric-dicitrate binding protein FerR (iron transport regulator)